jgi:hypothetical protein
MQPSSLEHATQDQHNVNSQNKLTSKMREDTFCVCVELPTLLGQPKYPPPVSKAVECYLLLEHKFNRKNALLARFI